MAVILTEASNEKLYQTYKDIFDKISELQRDAYELMFKNGWYTLEAATKTKIDTLHKNLTTEIDSLN